MEVFKQLLLAEEFGLSIYPYIIISSSELYSIELYMSVIKSLMIVGKKKKK